MPQKHDRKWIKRQHAQQETEPLNTEALARLLVQRGLTTPSVLDHPRTGRRDAQQKKSGNPA